MKTVETASNKLFGINWCVIHKELLINVGLILPMERMQSSTKRNTITLTGINSYSFLLLFIDSIRGRNH